jgi:hypothetical protein
MLCSEHLLLLLAAHGCHHCWDSLKWICDIDALARGMGSGLIGAIDRAKSLGCQRMVLVALNLAASLLRTPLPRECWPLLKDPALVPLALRVGNMLTGERAVPLPGTRAAVSNHLTCLEFSLRCRERFLDRVQLVADQLTMLLRPQIPDEESGRHLSLAAFCRRCVRLLNLFEHQRLRETFTRLLRVTVLS